MASRRSEIGGRPGKTVRAAPLTTSVGLGSPGGAVQARVREDGLVSVDMGTPNFAPRSLPMDFPQEQLTYALKANGAELEVGAVSMGNPHIVLRVADTARAAVESLGPQLEHDSHFPNRTNVGFMQIVNRDHIVLRVFERGAGETLACGTGACAAMVIGRRWGLLETDVRVDLPGGTAWVSWAGFDQHVWLTGPATTVFKGSIDLSSFMGVQQ